MPADNLLKAKYYQTTSSSSAPSPFAFNLSQHQGLLQWVALHIRWPKYQSFSFSISPSNEHSVLISFRMDWFDLLAVQGTLKSLLQHHSSKASILWHSAFFIVQLSHPYMKRSEVTQSCLTLCNPMDCSLPCFSVHGIFQARVLTLYFPVKWSLSVMPDSLWPHGL